MGLRLYEHMIAHYYALLKVPDGCMIHGHNMLVRAALSVVIITIL